MIATLRRFLALPGSVGDDLRMLARLSLSGLASLTLLAFGGCKAETGGGGSGIPKDEAPEEFAELVCGAYYSCDCTDHNNNPPFTSEDNCKAEIEANALADIDTADDADLIYDEACARVTYDFLDDLDCDTWSGLTLDQLTTLLAGFDCKIWHGTDEPGDNCEWLDTNADSCVETATCQNGTCVESSKKDPGDDCGQGDVCTGGSICTDISGGNDNKCELLPKTGETCLGMADLCDIGLTCNQTDKVCEVAPAAGETCAPPGISVCAEDLYCDMDTCTDLPTGGEACTPANQCAPGFGCRAGQCETEAPIICTTTELAALG